MLIKYRRVADLESYFFFFLAPRVDEPPRPPRVVEDPRLPFPLRGCFDDIEAAMAHISGPEMGQYAFQVRTWRLPGFLFLLCVLRPRVCPSGNTVSGRWRDALIPTLLRQRAAVAVSANKPCHDLEFALALAPTPSGLCCRRRWRRRG